MVTLTKSGGFYNRKILEIDGLKSDKKPTDTIEGVPITNGSIFREMDGDIYKFDEENHRWLLYQSISINGSSSLDAIKSININTAGNLEINTTDEKVKEVDFTVP